eukprot:UC1_evm13s708
MRRRLRRDDVVALTIAIAECPGAHRTRAVLLLGVCIVHAEQTNALWLNALRTADNVKHLYMADAKRRRASQRQRTQRVTLPEVFSEALDDYVGVGDPLLSGYGNGVSVREEALVEREIAAHMETDAVLLESAIIFGPADNLLLQLPDVSPGSVARALRSIRQDEMEDDNAPLPLSSALPLASRYGDDNYPDHMPITDAANSTSGNASIGENGQQDSPPLLSPPSPPVGGDDLLPEEEQMDAFAVSRGLFSPEAAVTTEDPAGANSGGDDAPMDTFSDGGEDAFEVQLNSVADAASESVRNKATTVPRDDLIALAPLEPSGQQATARCGRRRKQQDPAVDEKTEIATDSQVRYQSTRKGATVAHTLMDLDLAQQRPVYIPPSSHTGAQAPRVSRLMSQPHADSGWRNLKSHALASRHRQIRGGIVSMPLTKDPLSAAGVGEIMAVSTPLSVATTPDISPASVVVTPDIPLETSVRGWGANRGRLCVTAFLKHRLEAAVAAAKHGSALHVAAAVIPVVSPATVPTLLAANGRMQINSPILPGVPPPEDDLLMGDDFEPGYDSGGGGGGYDSPLDLPEPEIGRAADSSRRTTLMANPGGDGGTQGFHSPLSPLGRTGMPWYSPEFSPMSTGGAGATAPSADSAAGGRRGRAYRRTLRSSHGRRRSSMPTFNPSDTSDGEGGSNAGADAGGTSGGRGDGGEGNSSPLHLIEISQGNIQMNDYSSGSEKEGAEAEALDLELSTFLHFAKARCGPEGRTTLTEVLPFKVSRRVAVRGFMNTLRLASMSTLILRQTTPFGRIDIVVND